MSDVEVVALIGVAGTLCAAVLGVWAQERADKRHSGEAVAREDAQRQRDEERWRLDRRADAYGDFLEVGLSVISGLENDVAPTPAQHAAFFVAWAWVALFATPAAQNIGSAVCESFEALMPDDADEDALPTKDAQVQFSNDLGSFDAQCRAEVGAGR